MHHISSYFTSQKRDIILKKKIRRGFSTKENEKTSRTERVNNEEKDSCESEGKTKQGKMRI